MVVGVGLAQSFHALWERVSQHLSVFHSIRWGLSRFHYVGIVNETISLW